jgi:hypothetical protein
MKTGGYQYLCQACKVELQPLRQIDVITSMLLHKGVRMKMVNVEMPEPLVRMFLKFWEETDFEDADLVVDATPENQAVGDLIATELFGRKSEAVIQERPGYIAQVVTSQGTVFEAVVKRCKEALDAAQSSDVG